MGDANPPPGGHQALIENFPNGVLVLFDADLCYRIVGPETLPFSGRKAADIAGRQLSELFPQETVSVLAPHLRATIDGDARSIDVDYRDRIHHIETRPVEIESDPYGVLVTQEVTEARRTAAELTRQNERLDQFTSMASHDLRNPLAIAIAELEQYRETDDDAYLDGVEKALQRLEELITDLTALARSNQSSGEHEPISLHEVAMDAWELIDTRSASLETDDCTISGDRSQLQALFENLFRNAVGHGGEDVIVRVSPLENGFYVEDTGTGIPPEKREDVFEHGFTTGYSGDGTGLTIVSRIADEHGLAISLSESREGGARFEFRPDSGRPTN